MKFLRNLKNFYYSFKASKSEMYYRLQKIDSFTLSEVKKRTSQWLNVLGLKKNSILVKEIYPGCFCIEKKDD